MDDKSRPLIKCWIMHQLPPHNPNRSKKTIKKHRNNKNKLEEDFMLLSGGFNNWFDSASERPQCLQKREHNILIATASSNAKNTDLKRKGIKKYTNFNTKYQTINKEKKKEQYKMARFSGKIGIQINPRVDPERDL